jgi:glycine cleavage system H protein
MKLPAEFLYSKDHLWIRVEGDKATVGITEHAQGSLGEVMYVEIPNPGEVIRRGEPFGVIESSKAVVDLVAPISGKVLEANESLEEDSSVINNDPFGEGWLLVVTLDEIDEIEQLLTADEYRDHLQSGGA